MVGEGGAPALPWLAAPLRSALATRHAHALLIHGPAGVGQFELAMSLGQAWLCEASDASMRPCGRCAACRLVDARSHPDLMVLLPPLLREQMGWGPGGDEGEGAAESKSKAKPSKEIKVDAVRAAVGFAQSSSARGRAKVVVISPAERMNAIAANALLKTLEEPPGAARFVLACASPDALLATIRSRCQALFIGIPEREAALQWLMAQSVEGAEVLLAAAGGQPLEALAWAREGVEASAWTALPKCVASGDASSLNGWPLPRAVDALQKLCHDAMLVASGMAPRYFPAASIPGSVGAALGALVAAPIGMAGLVAWSKSLTNSARQSEHPWNAGLMIEALVEEARQALSAAR